MSFFEILDALLLRPLQLLFEVVYMVTDKVIDNPGLSIVVLSLFVNFLVLPLYIQADNIQEEEHAIEKKLQSGVEHIKKTFRGDERMLLLQAYYRQNGYKPVYVLRSAVSLLLQIPLFIAAYRFLSGLQQLNGATLGPIADLGSADGILRVGGCAINVLPIVMTIVNLVSCAIFTKGSTLKTKIQLYAMALFFLVFLYSSPAGLALYWTLNNIFSLVKNVFYKLRNPGKAFGSMCSASGIALALYAICFFHYQYNSIQRKILLAAIGVLLQMPLLYNMIKKREKKEECKANRKVFFSGALFLAALTGALIPSAVIKSSPMEFVNVTYFYNPLWFIVSSFCVALGIFVVWAGIFYSLAKPSIRVYFDKAAWIFSGAAVVDYMFFGRNLGLLTSNLKYENGLQYARGDIFWNTIIVFIVVIIFYILYRKRNKLAVEILAVSMVACSVMAIINISDINKSINDVRRLKLDEKAEIPEITLSRSGKNVIVLMLDRGMGAYIPYIFREKPELKEKFSGFTYYTNMVSLGGNTNFSTPSLFGGYEYTPLEINRRSNESLQEKHDEALKVMPVLFCQNDYDVMVCDPPYAGYQWIPDLSIYDEYPQIKGYLLEGKLTEDSYEEQRIRNNKRNFFCYSIIKTLPVCFQKIAYDQGRYYQSEMEIVYSEQIRDGLYTAEGLYNKFMDGYNVLTALPDMTTPVDDKANTFLMMANDITHEPMLLQEPDYLPQMKVDNIKYQEEYPERFTINGQTLKMETEVQLTHYQTNMAVMLQLGKWFDYMRENNVYDNTRIILVSDHGCSLLQLEELILENGDDMESHYALLMVKDFGDGEFEISEEFMTCGDVPALATEGIIENPINPFTGKQLGYGDKAEKAQYIIGVDEADIATNNGNQFHPARWYTVWNDMRKADNWKLVAENAILPVEE